ncbi:MAG TPA: 2-dehydropantoate 2-reductase N-terminal domain-containing protein [Turneriella sp.]|nr:2-dehydropantoate 2-reductase N-terminal domain-containing protein [Turneriella sp.]
MPQHARIALLGTGAIGASVARALYLNQVPFTILVRDKKRKADLITQGIRYTLKSTTHIQLNQGVEVLTLAEAQKNARSLKFDYMFFGMKTPHLQEAARTAKGLLAKGGRLVLLQNGLPERELRNYKEENIISGIVGYNAQLMPDGSYFQSNPGHLILANAHRYPDLLTYPDNIRQLDGLERLGVLTVADAARLRNAYRGLRRRIHQLKLQEQPARIPVDEARDERDSVIRIWRRLMEGNGQPVL